MWRFNFSILLSLLNWIHSNACIIQCSRVGCYVNHLNRMTKNYFYQSMAQKNKISDVSDVSILKINQIHRPHTHTHVHTYEQNNFPTHQRSSIAMEREYGRSISDRQLDENHPLGHCAVRRSCYSSLATTPCDTGVLQRRHLLMVSANDFF